MKAINTRKMTTPDIIIIGAGHAGIEAAHIAAKMGASVLLITTHVDLIGQMSCNPAIGGVAKGNIVREIDALGGVMGQLADGAGIHFRMLNASKGSAVWGPRAQTDRIMYRRLARKSLENCRNITILQAMVVNLDVSTERNRTVILDNGEKIAAKTVIIAAGTFLNGVIHIGLNSHSGGRAGEPPARGLTESIRGFGIASGRLKTGTPPRIDGRTVDYSRLAVQRGDDDPWPFSFSTSGKLGNKIVCWSTKTNNITHLHIRDNMDRSPLYTGKIQSTGPRYCPSIEDKVIRFGDRDGHILYLEPESLENHELYLNGLSTSLPFDVQEKMVASIEGLENARILRPGYGIEYDYFQPLQLKASLESKVVPGLFFAGQVNGTSGYEEAACQGLMAGINAVLSARGEEPVVLGRDTSYIGVLIDDLVTKGTEEPYRMFTSRAEYRLLLRQDNCDERLMPIGYELGTVGQELYDARRRFWDRKREVAEWLGGVRVTPEQYNDITGGSSSISKVERAADLLKRPEVGIGALLSAISFVDNDNVSVGADIIRPPFGDSRDNSGNIDNLRINMSTIRGYDVDIPDDGLTNGGQRVDTAGFEECENNVDNNVAGLTPCGQTVDNVDRYHNINMVSTSFDRHLMLTVESDIKYEGFVRKQVKDIENLRKFEETRIPGEFSYDDIPGLLTESRQKLMKIRPGTLGQASRIGGVTPADVAVLAMVLKKRILKPCYRGGLWE